MVACRLKVLHVIFQTTLSGAPRAALGILTRLNRECFEPELVCGGEGEVAGMARAAGLPVHFIPAFTRRIDPLADLSALRQMARLFSGGRYNLVHTHSSKAGFLGRLAARLAGVPVRVHTVQGFAFHEFSHGLAPEMYVAMERLAGRWSSAVVFVNDEDCDLALRRRIVQPEQAMRLTNGIDLDLWPPLDPERRLGVRAGLGLPAGKAGALIVMVGRIAPQKAPHVFVRAAHRVAQTHPEARFALIGEGEIEAETRRLIEDLGASDRIRMLGWRADVPDILRSADAFALASLWEGLSVAILEAMAARLPVVSTDIKGNRELVDHEVTGLLVRPGDVDGMAEAMRRLLEDPALASRLADTAYARVQARYSLESVVERMQELYFRLAAPQGAVDPS